jgi:hypothetical protein
MQHEELQHNISLCQLYLPVDSIETTSRMSRTQQFKRHRGVLPKSSDDSVTLPLPPNVDNLGYELGWHSVKYSQLIKFKEDQVPFLVHAHCVWQFTTESQMQHKKALSYQQKEPDQKSWSPLEYVNRASLVSTTCQRPKRHR